jgi:hypothetical protein
VAAPELGRAIQSALAERAPAKRLDNFEKIVDAVRQLL